MKTTIALILLIGGMAVMVGGFVWAVWEFAQLYNANLSNGMADGPDPKQTSSHMLTAAGIGLAGFVPMTAGSIMLGKGILSLIIRKMTKTPPAPTPGPVRRV